MIVAECSCSSGVLVCSAADQEHPRVVFVDGQTEWSETEIRHLLSSVDDWQLIEGADEHEVISKFSSVYWLQRAVGLCMNVLEGLSFALEQRVLEHIEQLFQTRCNSELVLDRLVVAPLRSPENASNLATKALALNYSAVAATFEALHDLQPILRRLTHCWLNLAPQLFVEHSCTSTVYFLLTRFKSFCR